MDEFKRNQVEEAIGKMFDPNAQEPSPELRMKIKRLLQADRDLGRKKGNPDPEQANYAFYSSEPPGTGVDIGFSPYDAFALLTGLRILEHGWPQGTVVSDLRKFRTPLEKAHAGILKRGFRPLDLDIAATSARSGDLAVANKNPVFLCIVSGPPTEPDRARSHSIEIRNGQADLMKLIRREAGQSTSIFELATSAHLFRNFLAKTEPRSRGRGSA